MTKREIENIYEKLFFEIITDISFLPQELLEILSESITTVNIKIFKIDEKIEIIESVIQNLLPEDMKIWNDRLQSLKEKRELLITKVRECIEIQQNKIHLWIDDFELSQQNRRKEQIEKEILYHTSRISELKNLNSKFE